MKNYDDIINLPHHQSFVHPQMTMEERAAQFSPFAALTGHSDAIKETARLTSRKIDLSEDEKIRLDEKIQIVGSTIGKGILFDFTYFVPDELKAGGAYISYVGSVKRIDEVERTICLDDHTIIDIDQIALIESDYFHKLGIQE